MWCKFILVLIYIVSACIGSKILVVFPNEARSHTVLGDSVVNSLIKAGHNVTYIAHNPEVKSGELLRVIDISTDNNEEDEPYLAELLQGPKPPYKILFEGVKSAELALRHQLVQGLMMDSEEQFDVVVAEWYYSGLLAPLAEVFECPLIWYNPGDASWMDLQLVHEPTSPLYGVDLQALSRAAAGNTVGDRLRRVWRQTYLSAWIYYITNYIERPLYYEVYQSALQERGRTPPAYEPLVYNASLLLINSSPLLGQGVPLPENAKYVGGHHISEPTEPLPQRLKMIMDNSKYGVIYFNLGSFSDQLPQDMVGELLRTFRQLEQTVIWKYNGHLDYVPTNVHLVKSVPHQSVLSHPKTRMIITTGEFLTYTEATYFEVPIIGIPLYGDQFLTMDIAQARGRGVKVLFTNRLPYRIKEAIDMILGNYKYRSNAKEASSIMRHRTLPASEELAYWIELVITTRGAPHLRSPVLHHSLMERLQVDIIVVILLVLWFLSKVFKLVKVYWDDWGNGDEDKMDKKED